MKLPTPFALTHTLVAALVGVALTGASAPQSPTLRVVAPAAGASFTGPDVTVRLEVDGAVLGGRARNGAHALLALDDLPPVKSYSPRFTFRGVSDGTHTLVVELRRAEGGEFDPPVRESVEFRVGAGGER